MITLKKISLFVVCWFLIETIIGLAVFSHTVITNRNWSEKKICLAWNHSCVDECKKSFDCSPDIECCTKQELYIWNKVKFYTGIAGLGFSIFLAGIAMTLLEGKVFIKNKRVRLNLGLNEKGSGLTIDKGGICKVILVGETGSGKSRFAENMYSHLKAQLKPTELGFMIFDMTRVEFTHWANDSYLISPVIYKPTEALEAFQVALKRLNSNKLLVIHIEECDMIYQDRSRFEAIWKSVSELKNVLVVFSTSRPSEEVITKSILENTDLKVVFKLSTSSQSERILGTKGAEKLTAPGEYFVVFNGKTSLIKMSSKE